MKDAISITSTTRLGNLLGGARHLGQCGGCCTQFLSTWDLAAEVTKRHPQSAPLAYTVTVCSVCANLTRKSLAVPATLPDHA